MAEPRRILLLASGFPRSVDDDHKPFLLAHARALAAAGNRVTVVCPGAPGLPGREEIAGVEVVRFRYGPRRLETLAYDGAMYRRVLGPAALVLPLFLEAFLATAVVAARRREVDVIHGHWWAPAGLVAVLAARPAGTASVVHLHGSDSVAGSGPARPLARWVLRHADAVLAVSDELAAWGREVSDLPVPVAPMPVDVDGLGAGPTPPPAGGPVLAAGRLLPEKGFDVLVRAAARTGDRLVVLGEGPERERLEHLAASLHVDLELPGAVAPGEMAGWYRRARVVAVPSRREGFGMVAAEAAAAGRAVVGSRVGGVPTVVDDGTTGLLVPPGDVDALATALAEVRPEMGAGGPERVWTLGPAAHARAVASAHDAAITARASRAAP
jgi:glycosyltransferase involved in cell wall biosynthesis